MQDDPCDFPAAHSMDTTWFAVDRDGHVAVFESGEAGAVPRDAYLGEEWGEPLDAVATAPTTAVIHDVRRGEHIDLAYGTVVVIMADLAAPPPGATAVETSAGRGWRIDAIDEALRRSLHTGDRCAGCAHASHSAGDDDIDPAAHGLFVYAHPDSNAIASAYRRRAIPAVPAAAASLPPVVTAQIVHFEGRFADTATLQPVEHWPSESWGAAFLASDERTVAAIPGKEQEYAEEAAQMGDGDGRIVTPPTAPLPKARVAAAAKVPWWKRLFGGGT